MEVIGADVSVILQKGKVLKAVKLQRGKKIVFEKLHFVPDEAIGQPYNSWFQVSSNELVKVENDSSASQIAGLKEAQQDAAGVENVEFAEDNRLLDDSHGKSQSLRREEIVDMKVSGAKGEDIVSEIVRNSSTFASKTTYSQKKYLKKKHKKHLRNICILKPSARLICKMYASREPAKICQMRPDTFSQILTMANVRYGSKVAVVETCSGVLLSLIMERLGEAGGIINLHTGETPTNFHAISHMNFPESCWALLHSLPMCKIGSLLANKTFEEAVGEITQETKVNGDAVNNEVQMQEILSGVKKKTAEKVPLTEEEKGAIRLERKQKRLFHQRSAWDMLKSKDVDAVIVACRFHPTPIVLSLLEFLSPSRPFVVHCENREPLMELFAQLSMSGRAVNLKISETFSRQYQVLPEQTHPLVTMSTAGGYLLNGVKVNAETASHEHGRGGMNADGRAPPKKAKVDPTPRE